MKACRLAETGGKAAWHGRRLAWARPHCLPLQPMMGSSWTRTVQCKDPGTFLIPLKRTRHKFLYRVTNFQSEGTLSTVLIRRCFYWGQKNKGKCITTPSLARLCCQPSWHAGATSGEASSDLSSALSDCSQPGSQGSRALTLTRPCTLNSPDPSPRAPGSPSQPLRRSEVETLLIHCGTFLSGSQNLLPVYYNNKK